MMMMKNYR